MSTHVLDRDGSELIPGDRVTIAGVVTDILLPGLQLVVTTDGGFQIDAVPPRAVVRDESQTAQYSG